MLLPRTRNHVREDRSVRVPHGTDSPASLFIISCNFVPLVRNSLILSTSIPIPDCEPSHPTHSTPSAILVRGRNRFSNRRFACRQTHLAGRGGFLQRALSWRTDYARRVAVRIRLSNRRAFARRQVCRLRQEPDGVPLLAKVENVRFRSPVYPGDTTHIEVKINETAGGFYMMSGNIKNGDKRVLSVDFSVAWKTPEKPA